MTLQKKSEILEKHFTHDKTLLGNDHYHAMDHTDLSKFVDRLDEIYKLLGQEEKLSLDCEREARVNARRSLVAIHNLDAGTIIDERHLTWKRPATGISPSAICEVIGRTTLRNIEEDEILTWDMFL